MEVAPIVNVHSVYPDSKSLIVVVCLMVYVRWCLTACASLKWAEFGRVSPYHMFGDCGGRSLAPKPTDVHLLAHPDYIAP